jgi:hypothetical protein
MPYTIQALKRERDRQTEKTKREKVALQELNRKIIIFKY